MDKQAVADILEEIATLLEIRGEVVFKSRAYLNAARTLRTLPDDLGELVAQQRLGGIKGFGKALVEKITTLVSTGSLPYLDELRSSVPAATLEILKVPGLGAKKASTLVDKLGIGSIGELEYACLENRLVELHGFGLRSQERILQGIEKLKRYRHRFLLGDVLNRAGTLIAALNEIEGIERSSCVGQARRAHETVRGLDLVVCCRDPQAILRRASSLPDIESLTAAGSGRIEAILNGGLPVRLVPETPQRYAFALLYETGSTAHLEGLEARARDRSLRLDRTGLSRSGEALPCADEAAIYGALDLPLIPPELRDDAEVIATAGSGSLPHLVKQEDVRGILHVHSTWSDGRLPIETIVRKSIELGYEYVGISDHSRSARYARGLTIESLRQQQEEIATVSDRYPGIRVLKGSEVDILPDGGLDYPDEVLDRLDFVVASVHSAFNLSRADQTRRILRAIEHPRTTILGHPTGRLLLARDPYAVDLQPVLEAAARTGVYMELNANPHRLDLDAEACRLGHSLGVRFAIDPDAHDEAGLRDVRFGVAVARRAGLPADAVLNTVPGDRLDAALTR